MKKFLVLVVIFVIGAVLFNEAYDKNVKSNCIKLKEQAEENVDNVQYFITSLNYNECKDAFGIIISAPVK